MHKNLETGQFNNFGTPTHFLLNQDHSPKLLPSLAVSSDEWPSGSFAALAFAYSDGETFLLKHAL